jgi:hypothetical protein
MQKSSSTARRAAIISSVSLVGSLAMLVSVLVIVQAVLWSKASKHIVSVRETNSCSQVAEKSTTAILCLSLARDILPIAHASLRMLDIIRKKHYPNLRLLVLENGSTDGSRECLERLSWVDVVSPTISTAQFSQGRKNCNANRINRMAALRNDLLEQARGREAEVVVVIDIDLHLSMNMAHFVHAVEQIQVRSDVSAWSTVGMHTFWTSPGSWIFRDSYAWHCDQTLSDSRTKRGTFMMDLVRTAEPGETKLVRSNFGGLTLYRAQDYCESGARYTSIPDKKRGEQHCEHTTFHLDLARRLYSNLEQEPSRVIVDYDFQHFSMK